jgi:hypothetical protein
MTLSLPNQNQFKDLNEKQIEAVTLQMNLHSFSLAQGVAKLKYSPPELHGLFKQMW